MTTTTTTTTPEYKDTDTCTHAGITATRTMWKGLGYTFYSNTNYPVEQNPYGGNRSPSDLELALAVERSGYTDHRALAWLLEYRDKREAEKTRSTALARVADAGMKMAEALGNIDARLRVYISDEIRKQLPNRY